MDFLLNFFTNGRYMIPKIILLVVLFIVTLNWFPLRVLVLIAINTLRVVLAISVFEKNFNMDIYIMFGIIGGISMFYFYVPVAWSEKNYIPIHTEKRSYVWDKNQTYDVEVGESGFTHYVLILIVPFLCSFLFALLLKLEYLGTVAQILLGSAMVLISIAKIVRNWRTMFETWGGEL